MRKETESRENHTPEFLYDSHGRPYRTEDLLKQVGPRQVINLQNYRKNLKLDSGAVIPMGYKFTPADIVWMASNSISAIQAKYPDRSRPQCAAMHYYAKNKVNMVNVHILKNAQKLP